MVVLRHFHAALKFLSVSARRFALGTSVATADADLKATILHRDPFPSNELLLFPSVVKGFTVTGSEVSSTVINRAHQTFLVYRGSIINLLSPLVMFMKNDKPSELQFNTEEHSSLTHYRPAMPFGNGKVYLRGSFQFSIVTI